MAAQDNNIKSTAFKKPLVVIKKESIFKPNRTIFMNTSLKRPITKYVAAKSGKKTCLAVLDEAQSGETLLTNNIKRKERLISSTNDITVGLTTSTETSTMIKKIPINNYCEYTPGYVPQHSKRCVKHGELPEYSAEGLLKSGLLFKSIEEFNEYCEKNAKMWNFDYRCSDSRNLKKHANYNPKRPSYVQYQCVFNKTYYERYKAKGIRKRRSVKVQCPAGVTMKCGVGKDAFKVENVCHHHSHDISAELFKQIPQGYRLPQEIKDEIRDLAVFNVDWMMINRYIESKVPDKNLKNFIYNIYVTIKKTKPTKDTMSPEKIKEILAKVKFIKENFAAPASQKRKEKLENNSSNVAKKTQKAMENDSNPKPKKKGKKSNHIVSVEDFELHNSAFETQTERWVESVLNETKNNDDDDNFQQEYQELPTDPCAFENSDIKTTSTYFGPPVIVQQEPILPEAPLELRKEYNIGGITIQTTEPVDESGVATIGLLGVERGFHSSEVINELEKVKSSITQPKQEQLVAEKQDVKNALTKKRFPLPLDPHQAVIRCKKRHDPLPEYRADGLIKVGDTFSSIEEFARYAAEHALKWFFYYQIHDSRNVKSSDRYNCKKKTWYNFSCRFNKGRYKSQSTGLRKVKRKTIQCPAALSMACEAGEAEFKVTYVCHHHSHQLSAEVFSREAHGYRLSSELKDEIRDLLWFRLDTRLIRQYLLDKTSFDLKRTIINLLSKMRKDRIQLYVPPQREKEILDKIQEIKQKFSIPKRAPPRKKRKLEQEEDMFSESDSDEGSGSRVEARLNNILYDQALIQSVKELQETTGCEIQIAPWREMHDGGGVSHLQAGLENTQNNELNLTHYDDSENQVEIDQEQYAIDDNAYLTHSNENIVHTHQFESTPDASTSYQDIKNDIYPASPSCDYSEEIVINTQKQKSYKQDENIIYTEEMTQTTEQELENDGNKGERQVMYHITTDYEQRYREGTYYMSRHVGVQVDLEVIQLEGEFEQLTKLESSMLKSLFSSEPSNQKTISVSTRGRPKVVLEAFIINRYNIEFYFNVGGVVICLENLALAMNLSVFDLLKKVYQGEAVLKMSVGRSGSQARKTVQLEYLPLTINFPFERFKCTNVLQEYKTICSKYTDMTIKLENTIASISTDLHAKNERLEMLVSQNEELIKEKKHYQDLESHAMKDQLLKQSQLDLAKAQAENQVLLQKITDLEALQLASRLKDAEILKQLIEHRNVPSLDLSIESNTTHHQDAQMLVNLSESMFLNELQCQKVFNTQPEDPPISNDKVAMLEENPQSKITMIEKIKALEEKVKVSDADNKRYKKTIRTLETSYINDNEALQAKIKWLEDEVRSLETEFDKMRNSGLELQNLRKKIIELEKEKTSEKDNFVGEIKRLYSMTNSLNEQLRAEKLKNDQVVIHYNNT